MFPLLSKYAHVIRTHSLTLADITWWEISIMDWIMSWHPHRLSWLSSCITARMLSYPSSSADYVRLNISGIGYSDTPRRSTGHICCQRRLGGLRDGLPDELGGRAIVFGPLHFSSMLNQKTRGKKHNLASLEESSAISYSFLYQLECERGLKEKLIKYLRFHSIKDKTRTLMFDTLTT